MTPKKPMPVSSATARRNTQQSEKQNLIPANEDSPAAGSGIFIKEVRIRHFRCLLSVDVELDDLSVLIGQNNSGKTSFLNALFAAIGAGQRSISSDDIFIRKGEVSAPKERAAVIDILIRPTDNQGDITSGFPTGSPWLELWGNGIVQDNNDNDLVAIRTSFKWSAVKGEYVLERRFLKDWQADSSKWEESKAVEKIGVVTVLLLLEQNYTFQLSTFPGSGQGEPEPGYKAERSREQKPENDSGWGDFFQIIQGVFNAPILVDHIDEKPDNCY